MAKKRKILNKIVTLEFLIEHHYVQRKSLEKIAEELNCTPQAVYYHAKKFDFKFLKDELKKGRPLNSSTKFKPNQKPWNYGLRGYKINNKPNPQPRGKDHWNWKGNGSLRSTNEYVIWRKKVYERDDYTCRECGVKGGKLNAHHIKEWCNYPDLRFDIDNGLTLCVPCHVKTDNYGNKSIKENRMKIV